MSDAAFEDFTKKVLELSYEQTLLQMEEKLKSLKKNEENYSENEFQPTSRLRTNSSAG